MRDWYYQLDRYQFILTLDKLKILPGSNSVHFLLRKVNKKQTCEAEENQIKSLFSLLSRQNVLHSLYEDEMYAFLKIIFSLLFWSNNLSSFCVFIILTE